MRKKLTFEQAEGMADLPRQLLPDEMTSVLRARLLHTILAFIELEMASEGLRATIGQNWQAALRRLQVQHFGIISTEFETSKSEIMGLYESAFKTAQPKELYGLIQALIRVAQMRAFSDEVARVLESEQSAYRLVDGDTLVPFGTPEEADTFARSLSDSKSAGLVGAHQHLKEAASQLSAGAFADSVRESLHAVESAIRSLTGKSSVSDALNELAKRRSLHESFKRGIMQLYGFGSDQPGVRHALLDSGDAAVKEEDAMFMLGTCAALVTYFSRSFVKA